MRRLIASAVLLMMAAGLFFLAVFLRARGLEVADKISSVLALFVALVALLQEPGRRMWIRLRGSESTVSYLSIDQALRDLADALEVQWRAEEEVRRINDPRPMPVPWRVATTSGDSPSLSDTRWSQFCAILDLYRLHAASGRLVILGQAGAGKSVLMTHLARDLLRIRQTSEPLPFVVRIGSWSPHHEHLYKFISRQLVRDYPALGACSVFITGKQISIADRLVGSGRLLPMLDGLDEMPTPSRTEALRQLIEIGSDLRFILTSRTGEYRRAEHDLGRSPPRTLILELLPLRPSDVAIYLAEATATLPEGRWDAVVAHLVAQPTGHLARVLTTPLYAWLTRTIYQEADTDPAELTDERRFGNSQTIETYLLDAFVPTVYSHRSDRVNSNAQRWRPQQAQRWLGNLARYLQDAETIDIAWWELKLRVPLIVYGLMGGMPFGIPIGLAVGAGVGLRNGLALGLKYGAVVGLTIGLLGGLPGTAQSWRRQQPSRLAVQIRGNLGRLLRAIFFGLSIGLVIGSAVGFVFGPLLGLSVGLSVGPTVVIALGLRQVLESRVDLDRSPSPFSVLRDDRKSAMVQAFAGGIALLVGVALVLGSVPQFGAGVGIGVGVTAGLVYGLAFSSSRVDTPSWYPFFLARAYLGVRGELPLRLMTFLDNANRRGVLRQNGAVYQFRHIRLQQRLAAMSSMTRYRFRAQALAKKESDNVPGEEIGDL